MALVTLEPVTTEDVTEFREEAEARMRTVLQALLGINELAEPAELAVFESLHVVGDALETLWAVGYYYLMKAAQSLFYGIDYLPHVDNQVTCWLDATNGRRYVVGMTVLPGDFPGVRLELRLYSIGPST